MSPEIDFVGLSPALLSTLASSNFLTFKLPEDGTPLNYRSPTSDLDAGFGTYVSVVPSVVQHMNQLSKTFSWSCINENSLEWTIRNTAHYNSKIEWGFLYGYEVENSNLANSFDWGAVSDLLGSSVTDTRLLVVDGIIPMTDRILLENYTDENGCRYIKNPNTQTLDLDEIYNCIQSHVAFPSLRGKVTNYTIANKIAQNSLDGLKPKIGSGLELEPVICGVYIASGVFLDGVLGIENFTDLVTRLLRICESIMHSPINAHGIKLLDGVINTMPIISVGLHGLANVVTAKITTDRDPNAEDEDYTIIQYKSLDALDLYYALSTYLIGYPAITQALEEAHNEIKQALKEDIAKFSKEDEVLSMGSETDFVRKC